MIDTINDRIERFEIYFAGQIKEILQLTSSGNHNIHYQRILLITVLEALGTVVFPNSGKRQQMVKLISNFSDWKESDRVSLPHLVKLLKLAPEPIFEPLRQFANREYNNWVAGEVITLDREPSFQDVYNLWPRDSEYKFPIKEISKEVTLESIQHYHLFYSHRNSLIHEFRMPGLFSSEFASHPDEPTYCQLMHNVDEMGNETTSWELIYPLGFYKRLAEKCLMKLAVYLRSNQIDPIIFFTSGSYWINELNR